MQTPHAPEETKLQMQSQPGEISHQAVELLVSRMQEHFDNRKQAYNAAQHMIKNDMRMDALPTLTAVKQMKSHALLDVLRFCPESSFYYEEPKSVLRSFASKRQLYLAVVDLVRNKNHAYDLYAIAELSERSSASDRDSQEERTQLEGKRILSCVMKHILDSKQIE